MLLKDVHINRNAVSKLNSLFVNADVKGEYFEIQNNDNIHYKFSQWNNQYIFDINISWQYFNIDIYENMLIPYNIAINIGNELNPDKRKYQFKLFGNNNFWWDFRGCGKLYLTNIVV